MSTVIHGVKIKKLLTHSDERGRLFEIWRADDPWFAGFGQAYVTTACPGVIKAWHMHHHQTDCFTVIRGRALFALYDDRSDSPTRGVLQTLILDDAHRQAIVIPPKVYHGFKNIGGEEVWCLNCPNRTYNADDPDEFRRDPLDPEIGFDWSVPA